MKELELKRKPTFEDYQDYVRQLEIERGFCEGGNQ
jgi:hypothetical protein